MASFVGLLEREPGSLYGLYFPDLPGCTTAARSLDEVVRKAPEALRLWAEATIDGGDEVPPPRPLDALMGDAEVKQAVARGAVPILVPLFVRRGTKRRVNISLTAGALAGIDEAARQRGLDRSAFLEEAARKAIGA